MVFSLPIRHPRSRLLRSRLRSTRRARLLAFGCARLRHRRSRPIGTFETFEELKKHRTEVRICIKVRTEQHAPEAAAAAAEVEAAAATQSPHLIGNELWLPMPLDIKPLEYVCCKKQPSLLCVDAFGLLIVWVTATQETQNQLRAAAASLQ